MDQTRVTLGLAGVLGLATMGSPAAGQQAIHTDLAPRVVRRSEGLRRYLADGRFMLLKVGPQANGANYLFMGAEDMPPGTTIPEHQHEVDEEILLIQRGRVRVVLNGDTTEAGIGDVVFLPPRSRVSATALLPDTATVYFVFPRGSVERCFQAVGRGAGDTGPRRPTHADTLEVPPACQMTYF
ncbi:MAG TPA: cupin domain-containing protein [Gemmatimonadales bacterium]|nr:cupin domain-containing protein [Gemmatimonadales bacterium]